MRINISLPEELVKQSDTYCGTRFMNRSELIKNALIAYINLIPASEIKTEVFTPTEPVLRPMCSRQFCKVRSEGHYKVITNDGTEEWIGDLCTYHWNKARQEGEVREV